MIFKYIFKYVYTNIKIKKKITKIFIFIYYFILKLNYDRDYPLSIPNPVHANQIYLFQMNRLSTFSENSSRFSISSSPSIARSIPQQPPTAPVDHQLLILSENSSPFSISSSPNISLNQQQCTTVPSEAYLKYIRNKNFKNHQIESKQYHRLEMITN